jgi:hypothetical protein
MKHIEPPRGLCIVANVLEIEQQRVFANFKEGSDWKTMADFDPTDRLVERGCPKITWDARFVRSVAEHRLDI